MISDDDDTDDEVQHVGEEEESKIWQDDLKDLQDLAFDDDSDFDEPKKKRSKQSPGSGGRKRQTNKAGDSDPSVDSSLSCHNGYRNMPDDTCQSNPICLSDSDE